jgi:hypothetical protein
MSAGVAIGSGVATLILLFLPTEPTSLPGQVLAVILNWAATLAAAALMAGLLNLLAVHFRKFENLDLSSIYSGFFLLAFFGVLLAWLLGLLGNVLPPDNPAVELLQNLRAGAPDFSLTYLQTPVEASLLAVLGVVMVLAGARLIRRRKHWSAIVFILITLFLMIGIAPLVDGLSILTTIRTGIMDYVAIGSARGILLSISLGVIATGLRVIIGVDQPYGE